MPLPGHPPLDEHQVNSLLGLCRRAGDAILDHYHDAENAGLLRKKADASPLTAADLAAHQIIAEGLAALTPGIPVLSEESPPEAIAKRHGWSRLWMVDPLDGTREFLERTGEFTVNIALIDEQRPIAGIIYRPIGSLAYLGQAGGGAWRYDLSAAEPLRDPLRTRELSLQPMVLFASRRHRNETLDRCLEFLRLRGQVERRNSGSALKFCDLASGQGDCYPRFSPCSEWDVAAGDALVAAAGGCVRGMDGDPLRYNARDTLLNPHFVAVGDRTARLWPELLEALK